MGMVENIKSEGGLRFVYCWRPVGIISIVVPWGSQLGISGWWACWGSHDVFSEVINGRFNS